MIPPIPAPRLVAFDQETDRFRPGLAAPPIVCASVAEDLNGSGRVVDGAAAPGELRAILDAGATVVGANLAYDFACAMAADESVKWSIFRALREGRAHDVLVTEALHAIRWGHLGKTPDLSDLTKPDGKVTNRYNLYNVTGIVLQRWDAKANAAWRMSYGLLRGVSIDRWPEEARAYSVDDVRNPLEVALAQLGLLPATDHAWDTLPSDGRLLDVRRCRHCGVTVDDNVDAPDPPPCPPRPRALRDNLGNLAAQVEADFCLKLGAAWSLRTDRDRVEALTREVEAKHAAAVARFQRIGWVRADGTEDQAAVKRAVARAYGATVPCLRCGGGGRVEKYEDAPCRGPKERGRYRGCAGAGCATCAGRGVVRVLKSVVTCKNDDETGEVGCDGSGYDLSLVPLLRRTDKGGVSTASDTLVESGDDDLMDYGENAYEKVRTTFVPYLRTGTGGSLHYETNVLVATGRCSVEGGPIHQFPRDGGVRECVCARPGCVLCSTDYASGELCTFAQVCLWIVGESKMAEVINATRDPGALHTLFASRMIGIPFEEAKALLVAGDKRVAMVRQAAKCFHPDTEILTRHRGWVRIADLTMDDEVASVFAEDCNVGRRGKVKCECLGCGKVFEVHPAEVEGGGGRNCSRACANRSRGKGLATRHAPFSPLVKQEVERDLPELKIDWVRPLRLTTRRATEGLLHLKNESIDLRVTPDHKMLVYNSTRMLRTVEARDFGHQRGWFNAAMWDGGDVEVDEKILRLAVATQADGNYIINGVEQANVRFGFSKRRKIDRLQSLLCDGEYRSGISSNGVHGPTTTFKLSVELSSKIKALLDSDKTLPWWWIDLTPRLRSVVLEEASYWDAHTGEHFKCYYYFTAIKKNTEVLQAIACITNRKATYVNGDGVCNKLSVKNKYDTRGGNVEVTEIDYRGDVYCLTVPSGCVLVRDGGIPVVTKQCADFGFIGGMGVATFVITKRRAIEGSTTAPDGTKYAGIRFCILLAGADRCGVEKVTSWKRNPCAPVCRACVEVVEEVLKPFFFRTYPEAKKYLKFVGEFVEKNGYIFQLAWDKDRQRVVELRRRGGVDYPNGCNSPFQGLLGDVGKRAYVNITREMYLGVRDDDLEPDEAIDLVAHLGPERRPHVIKRATKRVVREPTPSPLAGCRAPLFLHDEPLCELPEAVAHEAGWRIAEIMVRAGRDLAPDVYWKAEPAIARYWSKAMKTVVGPDGRLAVWEPKARAA